MQGGRIYRPNGTGNWYLRYVEKVIDPSGKVTKRKAFKKLADYGDEYKTEKSVQPLADMILAPINTKAAPVESVMTVADFYEHIFLPERASKLKPATQQLYRQVFRLVKPHLGNITLREFRVSDATRVLEAISRKANGEPGSHGVNRHNKAILSALFKHARQTDRISHNPVTDAALPQGKQVETYAYSLDEVKRILKVLKGTCRALVATAAYSGLRISEIRGLRWEDIDANAIYVRRSVWNRKIGDVKREASGAPVPLMATLKRELAAHRKRNPHTEWVFQNRFGRPLQTNYCSLKIRDKAETLGIKWYGWHAFRRGLATNLHDAGVDDLTVAGILRHADVSTTRACYIKRLPQQSVRAMKKLERRF